MAIFSAFNVNPMAIFPTFNVNSMAIFLAFNVIILKYFTNKAKVVKQRTADFSKSIGISYSTLQTSLKQADRRSAAKFGIEAEIA